MRAKMKTVDHRLYEVLSLSAGVLHGWTSAKW